MLSLLAGILLLTACTPPGMKLDSRPAATPAPTEMGGLRVTLRPLDPQAVASARAASAAPADLAELVSDRPQPYRIGPQDVLLVTVWDHPEITLALGQYRTDQASGTLVEEDGTMYFPYVGKLMIKGLTISEARARLTAELAKVLRNPQVDLKVLAFRSQKVYVGGEVHTPAVYSITDVPFTLAEAMNRAGGFTPAADDSRLLLARGDRTWRLDFQDLLARGNRIGAIYLKDGDSLTVPNNLEDPVYLLGEVTRPGSLPLVHGNLSLAKALADAGGILGASADARSIYVIRQGQTAKAVDVYHLDARNPTAMVLADQFPLRPRDIVYVDAGTLVRFSRVMDLLLPTVNAVTNGVVGYYEIRYFKNQ
jgi:polysaccharide export outer membrane protein